MRASGHGELECGDLLDEAERQQSVVISDPDRPGNPIIYVSEGFERQTGYPPEETLGRNCKFLQGPKTDPAAVAAIRAALRSKAAITVDLLNYKKDGTPFWNRLRIRPLHDGAGRLLYFAGAQNPIRDDEVRPHPVDGVVD